MKSKLLVVLFLALLSNFAIAHGIKIETEFTPPFVMIKASFSSSAACTDASVIITSGDQKVFQLGRTDLFGKFAFMPDKAGNWSVVVDDERGHKKTINFEIADSFFVNEKNDTADNQNSTPNVVVSEDNHKHNEHLHFTDIPMAYKVIFGLSLILGITGLFYIIKSRKKS